MNGTDIKSYRDLLVWQQAMKLAVLCYSLTRKFPKEEMFGLTSQIRRPAASIGLAGMADIRSAMENCDEIGKMLRSLIRAIQDRK